MAALIFFYRHFNPADASSHAPRCILRAVSGYDCPGCGSQRAFHAMLNGNIAEAWNHNGPAIYRQSGVKQKGVFAIQMY